MRNSLILLFLVGCMHNPVPDERILDATELPTWTHGLWVVVEPFGREPVDGELLAAGKDGVVVLAQQTVLRFRPADCETVTVAAYRTHESVPGVWTALGVPSTISHGGWLLISAPVWLATGLGTAIAMHNRPIFRYPDDPMEELARFARFPQGIPPGWTPP